jgi:hypothetical protein
MADMDPMSEAIGKLTAEAAAGTNQRAELFKKVNDIEASIFNLTTIVERGIVSTQDALKGHSDKLENHGASLVVLHKFKNRMYIGMAGIGGTGGLVALIKTKLGL